MLTANRFNWSSGYYMVAYLYGTHFTQTRLALDRFFFFFFYCKPTDLSCKT